MKMEIIIFVIVFILLGVTLVSAQVGFKDGRIINNYFVSLNSTASITTTVNGSGEVWIGYDVLVHQINATHYQSWLKNSSVLIGPDTNETKVIQGGIDWIYTHGGGTIFLGAGTYFLDNPLLIQISGSRRLSFIGANKFKTQLFCYNIDCIKLDNSLTGSTQAYNYALRDFSMWGNASNKCCTMIDSADDGTFYTDTLIENIYIKNCGTAVYVGNTIGATFQNVRVDNCRVGFNATNKDNTKSINTMHLQDFRVYDSNYSFILDGNGGNCNLNLLENTDGGDAFNITYWISRCDNSILLNPESETVGGIDMKLDGSRWAISNGVNFDYVLIGTESNSDDNIWNIPSIQGVNQNWTFGSYADNNEVNFGTEINDLVLGNIYDYGTRNRFIFPSGGYSRRTGNYSFEYFGADYYKVGQTDTQSCIMTFDANNGVCTDTVDGSDNGYLTFAGGGAYSKNRGGSFALYGNENAYAGVIWFEVGDTNNVLQNYFMVRTDGKSRFKVDWNGTVSIDQKAVVNGELKVNDLVTGGNAGTDLCADANGNLCLCGSCA